MILLFLRFYFISYKRLLLLCSTEQQGFVCIFCYAENRCFAAVQPSATKLQPAAWILLSNYSATNNILMPTPVPDAFMRIWILPRPKKHATGMFFTLPPVGPASSNPYSPPIKTAARRRRFYWRRVRDSNPRFLAESLVFKTSSLNHSDNSP